MEILISYFFHLFLAYKRIFDFYTNFKFFTKGILWVKTYVSMMFPYSIFIQIEDFVSSLYGKLLVCTFELFETFKDSIRNKKLET